MGQRAATAVPPQHKGGVVVNYVQTDASVVDALGSHEEQEIAYAKLAFSDGYPKEVVHVHRDAWSGAPSDSPQFAELRRLSAAGELEALYVCCNDRVSGDLPA